MRNISVFISSLCLLLLASCSAGVPGKYTDIDALPPIFPEYTDVTVPCNIAPLAFKVDAEADEYVIRAAAKGREIVVSGNEFSVSLDEWRELLAAAKGDKVAFDVFVGKDRF